MTGTRRLNASSASTTLRFTLQEELDFDCEIPAGTKAATADGKTIFATDKSVIIQAGVLSGAVSASAQASGSGANGFVAGQVCVLVDPVAYVASVENTTTTMLGADVETDAHYRQRIQESPEAYTCAGPCRYVQGSGYGRIPGYRRRRRVLPEPRNRLMCVPYWPAGNFPPKRFWKPSARNCLPMM